MVGLRLSPCLLATLSALVIARLPLGPVPALGDAPLPGERCTIKLPGNEADWLPQEHWTWQQICEGKPADLTRKYAALQQEECPETNVLGQRFLDTILFHEPYTAAIQREGVRIVGACFPKGLDLSGGALNHSLVLTNSRFGFLRLVDTRIDGDLGLKAITVLGALTMDRLRVEGNLDLSNAQLANASLLAARIGASFVMETAVVSGRLNMNRLRVAEGFFLRKGAKLASLELVAAQIGTNLEMGATTVTGRLDMAGVKVGGSLYMNDGSRFARVDLRNARIDESIYLNGATVTGPLYMDSSRTEQDVVMGRNADIGAAFISYASIGGNLDLSGGLYSIIDLTGTKIGQDLRLGETHEGAARFRPGATLILQNASVQSLQDLVEHPAAVDCLADVPSPWAPKLVLDGFAYERLGGLRVNEASDISRRPADWLVCWLGLQQRYSPQAYIQLSSVLKNMGYEDKAIAVLYASKNRELANEPDWAQRVLLWLHRAFIGYGYRPYWALGWALFFIILGAATLWFRGQYHKISEADKNPRRWAVALDCLLYSFDMLLPIIRLRELHYQIDLDGPARYYYYFHKVMGYVLAGFLAASAAALVR